MLGAHTVFSLCLAKCAIRNNQPSTLQPSSMLNNMSARVREQEMFASVSVNLNILCFSSWSNHPHSFIHMGLTRAWVVRAKVWAFIPIGHLPPPSSCEVFLHKNCKKKTTAHNVPFHPWEKIQDSQDKRTPFTHLHSLFTIKMYTPSNICYILLTLWSIGAQKQEVIVKRQIVFRKNQRMLLLFYNFQILPQNLRDFAIGTSPVSSSTNYLKSPMIFF